MSIYNPLAPWLNIYKSHLQFSKCMACNLLTGYWVLNKSLTLPLYWVNLKKYNVVIFSAKIPFYFLNIIFISHPNLWIKLCPNALYMGFNQGLVKGAKLCLNPYFFGWLEKWVGVTVEVIGIAAIGTMGTEAPLTRKGTCLSETRKYWS